MQHTSNQITGKTAGEWLSFGHRVFTGLRGFSTWKHRQVSLQFGDRQVNDQQLTCPCLSFPP